MEGGFYLPPIPKTPVSFLRDVLKGDKKLILKKDLCEVDLKIPRFSELSVKNFWNLIKERPELNMFFPDYTEKQLPENVPIQHHDHGY